MIEVGIVLLVAFVAYCTRVIRRDVECLQAMSVQDWRADIRRVHWWATHMDEESGKRVGLAQAEMLREASQIIMSAITYRMYLSEVGIPTGNNCGEERETGVQRL